MLRDAVLSLADEVPAGRALVNSGRLSVPTWLHDSPLNTPDVDAWDGWMMPGAPTDDAPVEGSTSRWLLELVSAAKTLSFVLLHFGSVEEHARRSIDEHSRASGLVLVTLPNDGLAARRYDARPGTCYLIRPDQHVAARWRRFDAGAVRAALARAMGNT